MQFGSHAHLATKIVVHRTKRKTGIIQKNSFEGVEEANAHKKRSTSQWFQRSTVNRTFLCGHSWTFMVSRKRLLRLAIARNLYSTNVI